MEKEVSLQWSHSCQ